MSQDGNQTNNTAHAGRPDRSALVHWSGKLTGLVLAVGILAAGVWVSVYWLENRPTPNRKHPDTKLSLVEVVTVSEMTEPATLRAMGVCVPSLSIQLSSRVSGEIVKVSPKFSPGASFDAGQQILQVDPKDYEFTVLQRTSDLAKAKANLKIEMGQQSVAIQEYKLLGEEVQAEDRELVLRVPQLAVARAEVAAAAAALGRAKLDLERTKITAPFNARVKVREVYLGSRVSLGQTVATLVGTDECWVQVSIPVGQLKWLNIPVTKADKGSLVKVYDRGAWGQTVFREGRVLHLLADLEPEGRMARILVSIPDPLHLKVPIGSRRPLLHGSYVNVEIVGRNLDNVVSVPRIALRDGKQVWLLNAEDKLEIRDVEVVWSGNDHVYVKKGLSSGERLIVSDMATPVAGMGLRTATRPAAKGPKAHDAKADGPTSRPEVTQ